MTLNSALDISGCLRLFLFGVIRISGMNEMWDERSRTNNPEQTGDLRTGKCVAEVAERNGAAAGLSKWRGGWQLARQQTESGKMLHWVQLEYLVSCLLGRIVV